MTTDTMTTRAVRFVELAGLAVAVEERRRQADARAELMAYRIRVGDAANWCAQRIFGREAAELLDWEVTNAPDFTAGPVELGGTVSEATVVIPAEPCSVLLAFRAPEGESEVMADNGSIVVVRECGNCGVESHTEPVTSLGHLGELLNRHRVGELLDPHTLPDCDD
ncbi:hypothetical protein [Streptomyces hydrogenans]|uniref:hypothetical protein n=1 Tax=Streptomyces hydrogenans TaxID=1873719 RepID=UPI003D76604E